MNVGEHLFDCRHGGSDREDATLPEAAGKINTNPSACYSATLVGRQAGGR